MSTNGKVELLLERSQALVLYEYLASLNDSVPIDEASQRVLWNVESMLEEKLVEIVRPDYRELLSVARDRVLKE